MKLVLFLFSISTALVYLATRLEQASGRVPFIVLIPLLIISMTMIYRLCDIGWQKPDADPKERFWARLLIILSTGAFVVGLALKAL